MLTRAPTRKSSRRISEHSLDADETARYELHFSQCARCRRCSRGDGCTPVGPQARPAKNARDHQHRLDLDWRWLAPAAAAIVLAAIWVARRPSPPHSAGESSRPLVAMNQPAAPPADMTVNPDPRRGDRSGAFAPTSSAHSSVPRRISIQRNRKSRRARKPAPASRDDRKEFATNVPLTGRNYDSWTRLRSPRSRRRLTVRNRADTA